MEKTRRNSSGGNRSRTMARDMTDPPQAATACTSRNSDITRMEGASAQAADEAINSSRLA
jgi:hypothetical protein